MEYKATQFWENLNNTDASYQQRFQKKCNVTMTIEWIMKLKEGFNLTNMAGYYCAWLPFLYPKLSCRNQIYSVLPAYLSSDISQALFSWWSGLLRKHLSSPDFLISLGLEQSHHVLESALEPNVSWSSCYRFCILITYIHHNAVDDNA